MEIEEPRKTILLVEDQPLIAKVEQRQLEEAGYRVHWASNGEEAITLACDPDRIVDLILMDIDLGPGMDGTQAAQRILQTKKIPLLFLSAHQEKEMVELTERITSYGYVVKNSSFTVLDASIKMAFKLFASEKALEDKNTLLNSLLDNLPMGVFLVEAPSGRPLVANETAKELLGRGILPDASRTNLAEVYQAFHHGTGAPYPVDHMPIVRGMFGERSRVDDMEVLRPDGTRTRLEVFGDPVTDPSGKILGSLVSFRDITRQKALLDELNKSRAHLNLALDAAAAGSWEWDLKTNENRWSDSLWPMYGLVPGTVKPDYHSWLATVHPSDRDRIAAQVATSVEEGEGISLEWRVHLPDEEIRWLVSRGGPLKDENNRVIMYLGIVLDITDLKKRPP